MTVSSLLREYIWLIKTIRQAGGITFREINERWLDERISDGVEIARTTFVRHRWAIEQMFGISIECDRKTNKYYIENEHVLSDESVQNWMLSTLSVNNIILDSISLHDRIFLESIPADACLDTIVEAMKKGRRVRMEYYKYRDRNGVGDATERIIEPYFIKLHKRRWYVMANTPSGHRLFSFDRIGRAELTKERYKVPDDFCARDYFGDCFGVMRDERYPAERIVLRALGREMHYIDDLPIHHTQRKIGEGDGYADYEVFLRPTSDFIGYLLSRGAWLKVLEPLSVAQMVRDNIAAMTQLYETAD